MIFKNRKDAGAKLAAALAKWKEAPRTIVLGLPRGGVVVAAEVGRALSLPLDIIVPRKIGAPHNPEFAIGALAGDVVWLDEESVADLQIQQKELDRLIALERKEAERRLASYRKGKPPLDVRDQTAIVVDDGIATGATMRASLRYLKKKGAKRIIVAVPVAPADVLAELKREADEIVCLSSPPNFYAVGQFYDSFPQTSDAEVIALL